MHTHTLRSVIGPALLAVLLYVAPFIIPTYWVMILSEILIMGLMAVSFNLLLGYTGLLSFGQAAFFGVGAYTSALMLQGGYQNLFLILLAGMFAAFLASLVVGFFSVRLDEIFFAMITLGLGMLFFSVAHNWIDVTGGSDGLPVFALPALHLFGSEITFYAPNNMYYLVLTIVCIALLLLWMIVHSPFGLLLKSIRENKLRVSFIGGNVKLLRVIAFGISGTFTGLAGILFCLFNNMAAPDFVHWSFSAKPVIMSIIGGTGVFLGPLFGAAIFFSLEQLIIQFTENWMLFLGIVLIPIVLFFPQGVFGTISNKLFKRREKMSIQEALRIENLGHSYGKFKVIEDISMTIGKGEMSALIGPNGAGKTTFYNAISGKFPPTRGKVFLAGEDITGLPAHKVVDKGMCRSFQITNIFTELTVLENVISPLILQEKKQFRFYGNIFKNSTITNRAMAILEQVGLSDRANQVVANLAYGDKRLVEMATVLVRNPSVVLLDEPTAGMNPEETENMINLIKKLAKNSGTTFFITEHDMKVVFSLAKRIYVLHQGHLLAEGSPTDIRNNTKVQEAYLGRKVNA